MTLARLATMPGVRTFASPRFRLLVAIVLAVSGIAYMLALLRFLPDPGHPWLEDFEAYYFAAQRMGAGSSPYDAWQLRQPVDAVCPGCYLYPPLLAQVLYPLSNLPLDVAKSLFAVVLMGSAWLSAWLGTGIGGARRTWERAVWCVVAVAFFFPILKSIWLGNVSTLVALAVASVALGGAAAGVGAAAAALMKTVPGTLVPVALVADRRSRAWALTVLVVVGGIAFLLAPAAWLDYPAVLRNLLAGSGDVYWNLAPATMAQRNGVPEVVVSLIRMASLGGGLLALGGSIWAARRPGGLPLAALLATVAMLIMPGTLWNHYLAVLLPLMAMAWPSAGSTARILLIALSVPISVVNMLYGAIAVAFFFALAIVVVTGWVLWRRMRATEASLAAVERQGPEPAVVSG